jgi:adhesin/invasin
MTTRRTRLSVEPLEDRTTPATAADLTASVIQTQRTAEFLTALYQNRWELTNPVLRPNVQAIFTNVFRQANRTLNLLEQFPDALPTGLENMARNEARWEVATARMVAGIVGFPLGTAPTPPPNPTPGAASPAKSTVAVAPASVAVGSTATVTLTAKDANGTALTTGGATVVFSLGSGTTVGTFGPVTDNHNGTYTATFTASTVGSNTIKATLNSQAVTTTAPTITVTAAPAPGAISAARSTVAVSPASVATGGTSTITLTAKDANGTPLTTGGATVNFALGSGMTIGGIGPVTNNNNGTYTATFTATTAGSNTITATINAQPVTTPAPTLTVTATTAPGPISLSQSTVAISPASVAVGNTATATLTAKDASGTLLTTGGSAVAFSLGTGTAVGTFGEVTDNHNGTYTATFTASTVGSNTVKATVGGQPVTSPSPTVTVTAAPTSGVASPAKSTVAISPEGIAVGGTTTVTLTAMDAGGTRLTTGGAAVAFAVGGTGAIQGTFSDVTDNHNGTYTATFTATAAGTDTVTATLNDQPVTTTAPSLTVGERD